MGELANMGMEGTGSRSYPVAGFCVNDFELLEY
jgi:hypothetical protein